MACEAGKENMKCPKCKSENVSVEMVEVGSKTKKSGNGLGGHFHNFNRAMLAVGTLGISNLVVKKAKGNEKTKVKNQKTCICQDCAYSWKVK